MTHGIDAMRVQPSPSTIPIVSLPHYSIFTSVMRKKEIDDETYENDDKKNKDGPTFYIPHSYLQYTERAVPVYPGICSCIDVRGLIWWRNHPSCII